MVFASDVAPAKYCSIADAKSALMTVLTAAGFPPAACEKVNRAFGIALRKLLPLRRRVLLAAEARRCGIKPNTARSWCRAGKLPRSVRKVGGRWTLLEGDLARMCMNPGQHLGASHAQVHGDSGRARPERSR